MAEGSTYSFKIAYVSGIFILLYALLIFINNNAKLKIPLVLLLTFSVSIIECTLNMDSTGIGTTSRTSYLLDYIEYLDLYFLQPSFHKYDDHL